MRGLRFQELMLQHSGELSPEDFDALVKDLGNAKAYMTQIIIQNALSGNSCHGNCAGWPALSPMLPGKWPQLPLHSSMHPRMCETFTTLLRGGFCQKMGNCVDVWKYWLRAFRLQRCPL